jgi:tetratricopeptide (TPR) repeat protein
MSVLAAVAAISGAGVGVFAHVLQAAPTAAAPSDTSPLLWAAMAGGAVLVLAVVLIAVSGAGQRTAQGAAPVEGPLPPDARRLGAHAARPGDTAMSDLGAVLQARGDLEGAERCWRQGADNGDIAAMVLLGALLSNRGDLEGAEGWWRQAADNGSIDAVSHLGTLLRNRGDLEGAERCWRQAAGNGDTDSMVLLGALLQARGDLSRAAWQ